MTGTGTYQLLHALAEAGVMPTPAALRLIEGQPEPTRVIELLLREWDQRKVFCDIGDIEEVLEGLEMLEAQENLDRPPIPSEPVSGDVVSLPEPSVAPDPGPALDPASDPSPIDKTVPGKRESTGIQKNHGVEIPPVQVIENSGEAPVSGIAVEDFASYFMDRFRSLSQLIRRRAAMREARYIDRLDQGTRGAEVKLIAMVSQVNQTAKGGLRVKLEDTSGSILATSYDDPSMVGSNLLVDEVVGIVGNYQRRNHQLKMKEVYRPSLERSTPSHGKVPPITAAFISDIHLGSKTFLEDAWERFMAWARGEGGPESELAGRLGYLICAGDMVDGIDAYPDQENDLLITDYIEQYRTLARSMATLPNHLQIVLFPGNHDTVRIMEPQPALPLDLQKHFSSNVTFLSNPASFDLAGVRVLGYHGKSIDDLVTHIPHVSYEEPLRWMQECLERRHLAPVYGDKTPITPQDRDSHVIRQVPHVFVTGHVHTVSVQRYKGVLMINAGTWQDQTDFQKMMNITPEPGKAVVVELNNLKPHILDFTS